METRLLNRLLLLTTGVLLVALLACNGAATATSISLPVATSTPNSQAPTGASPTSVPSRANSQANAEPQANRGTAGDSPSAGAAQSEATTPPASTAAPLEVPALDRSIHSVPLQEILFDTFGGNPRFISLDSAIDEVILQLRDRIRSIPEPAYGTPRDLPWLEDDDLVIGYRSGDDAYAYPVNVLDFHELVTDVIDGVPVLITYCPLCFSGVVFSRDLDGRVLTFGNTSALFNSDLVLYDHQTGSYWFQVGGEAIVGPLTNSKLNLLPSTTIAWGEWRRLFPQTRLLTGIPLTPGLFGDSRYAGEFRTGFRAGLTTGSSFFLWTNRNWMIGSLLGNWS